MRLVSSVKIQPIQPPGILYLCLHDFVAVLSPLLLNYIMPLVSMGRQPHIKCDVSVKSISNAFVKVKPLSIAKYCDNIIS